MNRIAISLFLLILLLMVQTAHAGEDSYNWIDEYIFFHNLNYFSLTDFELRLPDKDLKTFSPDAKEKLTDLVEMYGDGNSSYSMLQINSEEKINLDTITDEIQQPEILEKEEVNSLTFTPLPGVLVNADISGNKQELLTEINTNINFKYKMNSRTMIRAGYVLASKEWWNIQDITLNNTDGDDTSTGDGTDSGGETPSDGTENTDGTAQEPVYNEDRNQQGSFGISYQTSDNVVITADYINNNVFSGNDNISTILGVEYVDEAGKLKAKYQVDKDSEKTKTITGLELDLNDLATISAYYKLLDPELIEQQLDKETVWDFGLDVNLSDLSSLSIGYQLIDNKGQTEDTEENKEKESNIKASFQIEF